MGAQGDRPAHEQKRLEKRGTRRRRKNERRGGRNTQRDEKQNRKKANKQQQSNQIASAFASSGCSLLFFSLCSSLSYLSLCYYRRRASSSPLPFPSNPLGPPSSSSPQVLPPVQLRRPVKGLPHLDERLDRLPLLCRVAPGLAPSDFVCDGGVHSID